MGAPRGEVARRRRDVRLGGGSGRSLDERPSPASDIRLRTFGGGPGPDVSTHQRAWGPARKFAARASPPRSTAFTNAPASGPLHERPFRNAPSTNAPSGTPLQERPFRNAPPRATV